MDIILCKKINKDLSSASFFINEEEYNRNFNRVLSHCRYCKFFDDVTDFPNCFCDKSLEMIDYHFCTLKCPLGKFEIVEEKK